MVLEKAKRIKIRKQSKYHRWMLKDQDMLDFINEIHVMATLLEYDVIKYSRWREGKAPGGLWRGFVKKIHRDFFWRLELQKDNRELTLKLSFRDGECYRVYFHFKSRFCLETPYDNKDYIRHIQDTIKEWL